MSKNKSTITKENGVLKQSVIIEEKPDLTLQGAPSKRVVSSSQVIADEPNIQVKKKDIKTAHRIQLSSFQARLGRRLDNIGRKTLDNAIRLSGAPVDTIRIECKRDSRSQDLISRKITDVNVVSIMWPSLKDIPMRQLNIKGSEVTVPSLYTITENAYFELFAPVEAQLNEDDLLIRILYDPSQDIEKSYVMVLQVSEVFGTFGTSSIKWKKLWATFYNEQLPSGVIQVIKDNIYKREILNW